MAADSLGVLRTYLLDRLLVHAPVYVDHLTSQRDRLAKFISALVDDRVNGACVLVGPPFVGKSHLTTHVLEQAASPNLLHVWVPGSLVSDAFGVIQLVYRAVAAVVPDYMLHQHRPEYSALWEHTARALEAAGKAGLAVLIVLEGFEQFSAHCPRALYSLVNLLQASACTLGFLGISSKLDVMDKTEKRTKSRLMPQIILCPPPDS
eukprot:gene6299-6113_t